MRRNVSVAFSHFFFGVSSKDSRRLRFFSLFRSGGCPVFCFFPFQIFPSASFPLLLFFARLSISSMAAPGYFRSIDKISRMLFSAADARGRVCFSWSFLPKAVSQEVEMNFHRNAHGKSRLKCFPVPVSLVVLVDAVHSLLAAQSRSRLRRHLLGSWLLIAHDDSWWFC